MDDTRYCVLGDPPVRIESALLRDASEKVHSQSRWAKSWKTVPAQPVDATPPGESEVLLKQEVFLRVDSEGITVTNSHGDQIENLRWSELSKVTASHKMSQLVLWDRQGNRRVVVDRNIDKFQQIRNRVLAEYAKTFSAAPLPIEFRRAKFWTPDAIACVGAAFVMGLMSFSVYRNGQPGSGVLLFVSFELLFSLYFLSINPQFFGTSQIFEDRIELNGVLKRSVVFKRDITSVEIVDFTAGQTGTSSMILVTAGHAKPLRIPQRYDDLPEIYLTIKAWLAR